MHGVRVLAGPRFFQAALRASNAAIQKQHDAGDHVIFLGAVERYRHMNGDPLLFNAGRYGMAAPHPDDHGELIESSDFADLLL